MTGYAVAHYGLIVAFSQTDLTDDLKKIDIPVLAMHGDDNQVLPYVVLKSRCLRSSCRTEHTQDLPGLPPRNAHDAGSRSTPAS